MQISDVDVHSWDSDFGGLIQKLGFMAALMDELMDGRCIAVSFTNVTKENTTFKMTTKIHIISK